ncbi:MAG: hypothetical protein ACUVWN_16980 [bacterium]
MAIFEVERDIMLQIFDLKQSLKSAFNAVLEGRLTAAHLSSEVFALIEKLEQLEVMLIGEPLVQEVPTAQEVPVEESQPEAVVEEKVEQQPLASAEETK